MANQENSNKENKPYYFQKGNTLAAGHGRPYAKQVHALKKVIFDTTTPHDMQVIWKKLLYMAKRGNMPAIREVMDRCFGKAIQAVEMTPAEAEENVKEMSTEELMRLAMGSRN